jgi:hypothetical protein
MVDSMTNRQRPRRRLAARTRQNGQALTEAIIWSTALVAFFFSLPLLGKFFDIKHKTLEASRYAVWERTLWSAPGDGDVAKSDAQIRGEIDDRSLGHPSQLLTSDTFDNPDWYSQDRRMVRNIGGNGDVSDAVYAYEENPVEDTYGSLTARFAHRGVGGAFGAALSVLNSGLSLVGCDTGLNLNSGLGLRGDGLARIAVTTPIYDRFADENRYEGDEGGGFVNMVVPGAILTDSWTTDSEGDYDVRVDGLVAREAVECMATPGALLARFGSLGENAPVIGEARRADTVPLANESTIILDPFVQPR